MAIANLASVPIIENIHNNIHAKMPWWSAPWRPMVLVMRVCKSVVPMSRDC